MPLSKSKGNMYDFVSHCHTHLGGACPHACSYCFVQAMAKKFPVLKSRYTGPVRLIEEEFKVNYGSGKTIFIEHMNDLFSDGVRDEWIEKILVHCRDWPDNKYIFQTKNPRRALGFINNFPRDVMIGTTIETNRNTSSISKAPLPYERILAMKEFKKYATKDM